MGIAAGIRRSTPFCCELNDGQHHLVPVPGGPHCRREDARMNSIYVQSPAKPYINYIYLDRQIAIRAARPWVSVITVLP
jgi:hypothetical protein